MAYMVVNVSVASDQNMTKFLRHYQNSGWGSKFSKLLYRTFLSMFLGIILSDSIFYLILLLFNLFILTCGKFFEMLFLDMEQYAAWETHKRHYKNVHKQTVPFIGYIKYWYFTFKRWFS